MHFAVGTSLAVIVPTAVSSLLAHHRRRSIDWPAVTSLAPGVFLGGIAGAALAARISSPGLGVIFGLFELAVAVHLVSGRQPAGRAASRRRAAGGMNSILRARPRR